MILDTDIREEVKILRHQFDTMFLNKPINAANTYQANVCELCASPMHFTQNCPTLRKSVPSISIENPQMDHFLRLTIQSGGITPISFGSKISRLIREVLPLKISINHLNQLNFLLIKCHSLHHSHQWKT
jgi:hypothetical protein